MSGIYDDMWMFYQGYLLGFYKYTTYVSILYYLCILLYYTEWFTKYRLGTPFFSWIIMQLLKI